jgi:hypothetical protein
MIWQCYLWMKLLFSSSVTVWTVVTIFTISRLSPFISMFNIGTRCWPFQNEIQPHFQSEWLAIILFHFTTWPSSYEINCNILLHTHWTMYYKPVSIFSWTSSAISSIVKVWTSITLTTQPRRFLALFCFVMCQNITCIWWKRIVEKCELHGIILQGKRWHCHSI